MLDKQYWVDACVLAINRHDVVPVISGYGALAVSASANPK
jgi:hypothetical protein